MAELIHEHTARVRDSDGRVWCATSWGEERSDGTWWGWLEFRPLAEETSSVGARLRTGQETSQPNRRDVEYWASGLEPVYLEGALQRAIDRSRGSDRGRLGRETEPPTGR